MVHQDKYKIWFSIRINHSYYEGKVCPVSLYPKEETLSFLNRNDIIFRNQDKDKWVCIASVNHIMEADEDMLLEFEIIPFDNLLYYVSGEPFIQTEEYVISKDSGDGKWIKLSIPLNRLQKEITINLEGVNKYWEYIVVPKYQDKNIKLKLKEHQDQPVFQEVKTIEHPSMGEVFYAISKEKVRLKDSYQCKIQLLEIQEEGEHVLSNNLPLPRPDAISVLNPADTITTYFYI